MYSFDHVIDRVYIGDGITAANRALLLQAKVTHILAAGAELTLYFPKEFHYLKLGMRDQPSELLSRHFNLAFAFIDEALASEGTVFIHCMQGMSRSPALMIAYVMHKLKLSFIEASALVKAKHVETHMNSGFVVQLHLFEKQIKEFPEELRPSRCQPSCTCLAF